MIQSLALTAPSKNVSLTAGGTWDKVVYSVSWFFDNLSPAFVWAVFALLICGAFFGYYWYCLRPRPHSLEWIAMAEERSNPRRLNIAFHHGAQNCLLSLGQLQRTASPPRFSTHHL